MYLPSVVEECEEGGEGKGGHEEGDEPVLDHHLQVLLEQAHRLPALQQVKKGHLKGPASRVITALYNK